MLRNYNDQHEQTENFCWAFDCDFEFLNRDNIRQIVVAGRRSRDLYLRLLMAGIPAERITRVDNELDVPDYVEYVKGREICLFYGTDALTMVHSIRDRIAAKAEGRQEA